MTSTVTGLPERYRPLDRVGPDEHTETGVIQTWRAKDRVLNRDVAVRVHTPSGPAAHAWISRALTAGGLATPALAMVYDASEGSVGRAGDDAAPGGAAYVVNEWIDGEPLSDRLAEGPLPEREVRTIVRRLADGVAEAHRVGLAVGGLTPENVVLRPNGLVGLRGVPAANASIHGDVAALGALLEACLTGLRPGDPEPRPLQGPSDLVALARRARSTEPGQALSSVAAMAAILAERPRTRPTAGRDGQPDDGVPGNDGRPLRFPPTPLPAVPRPVRGGDTVVAPVIPAGGDTVAVGPVSPPVARDRDDADDFGALGDVLHAGPPTGATDLDDEDNPARRRLLVIGLPLLALLVVVALAWWVGSGFLSVAGSADRTPPPAISAPAAGPSDAVDAPAAGEDIAIRDAEIFDPEGDGAPENDGDVPLTYDGDSSTTWSTVAYRGSANFGNLKSGMGILYDLGSAQELSGVTVATPRPGATVEIRTADSPAADAEGFDLVASGTLEDTTDLRFDEPVEARYVLLWITGLVGGGEGFTGEIGEVAVQAAG